jgi:ABC-2 type transport system ATP-binding protein
MSSEDRPDTPAAARPSGSPAVVATRLTRHFRIAETGKGVSGAFRALFSRRARLIRAVEEVSFEIATGSFVGYIGPNGAGKSTTVKMLCGILHPTAGEVSVLGLSPQKQRQQVARRIGVVFGQRTQLWWDLPLADSYELLAAMYGVPQQVASARLRRFDEVLGISEFLDVQVRRLSLGQRMRADLAGALLHAPEVLFLDEPTIGLDVVAKAAMRDFLREINRTGVTILLTTHDMDDVAQLCDRIVVINHGRLAFDGTLDSLRRKVGVPTRMDIDFTGPPRPPLPALNCGIEVIQGGARVTVSFDRAVVSAARIISAFQDRGEIRDIQISEPDIDEIVRRIYAA